MSQQPSINPKDMLTIFQEDYLRGLPDLLSVYAGKERRRGPDEDDEQERETRIRFKCLPSNVNIALRSVKESTGHGFGVLTKCMSHHVIAWCNTLPVREIGESFVWINDMAAKYGGMSDIVEQVEHTPFRYLSNDPCDTDLRSIEWVKSRLYDMVRGTGIDMCELFGLGLMWSLTKESSGGLKGVIRRTFLPELENFMQYLEERSVLIKAYRDIVGIRVARAVKETPDCDLG